MHELDRIRAASAYFRVLLQRRSHFETWLWNERQLYRRYPLTGLYNDLQETARKAVSFQELFLLFREFKQRHFLRIGGRDLLGLADLSETTSQISDLASVALQVGFELLSQNPQWWAGNENHAAWAAVQRDTAFTIMGLGKLGGGELNYVSDVDLIFLFEPRKGECPTLCEPQVLYAGLCQALWRLLADSVEGDRVFQVDLRLRPLGKDGVLVPSVSAASEHYLNGGRPWERQMLLKARPVAGDRSLGMAFVHEVRPFVFRRFLDFQALDELKAMRDRILAEAVRPGKGYVQFDVKLGIGGIREVEFLVQVLQLIYGGRHPDLDEPNTLRCLDRLSELHLLSDEVKLHLSDAYTFLRRVEHWVQLDANRQTQKLPQSEEARRRLVLALGFEGDEKGFLDALAGHCDTVHRHFLGLFGGMEEKPGTFGKGAPEPATESSAAPAALSRFDPAERFPSASLERLRRHLDALPDFVGRAVLEVLDEFAALDESDLREKVIVRLERYWSQVMKRPGLIKVFGVSRPWLSAFCRAVAQCDLVAELLAHHPGLVEGLATQGGVCLDAPVWEGSAARLLDRADGYEERLEWIRRLKNERVLQLILCDLQGGRDDEALEEELSRLADFVLRTTYAHIRENVGLPEELPMAVLAMGKLGSREMGYLSDLDLAFVYDPPAGEPQDLIPSDVVRFVQRFMRLLSTPLQDGPGYAVDARLRPTGNYGPLIVTRRSWLDYYENQADLWEIQALLRVRAVTGHPELGRWVENRAEAICYKRREAEVVWSRLCHLRGRMQRERSEERGDDIDLKLGPGGLVDLEFLVQGRQMVEGYAKPALRGGCVRTVLRNVLEDLALSGTVLSIKETLRAFQILRSLDHRLRLFTNVTSSCLDEKLFESLRSFGLWPPVRPDRSIESWQELLWLRRRVRDVLRQFCPNL